MIDLEYIQSELQIDDDGNITPTWLATIATRCSHNGWPLMILNGEIIGSVCTVAFCLHHGRLPQSIVCHKDHDKTNNSKDNLFEAHHLRELRKDPFSGLFDG